MEQIKRRARYLINIVTEKILPLSYELKTNNNYLTEKRKVSNRLSFVSLDLIGKEIVYYDDENIIAKVVGDKEVADLRLRPQHLKSVRTLS